MLTATLRLSRGTANPLPALRPVFRTRAGKAAAIPRGSVADPSESGGAAEGARADGFFYTQNFELELVQRNAERRAVGRTPEVNM